MRSNAIQCTKCNHSFAALEAAKRCQASIKWSEDLTTKSDRSARASVAKRRQRAFESASNAASFGGTKKRNHAAVASDEVLMEPPPSKIRKSYANAGSSMPFNIGSSIPPKQQVHSGRDPRDAIIDYSILDGFSNQMAAKSTGESVSPATNASALGNNNHVGQSAVSSMGSPIESPTFAGTGAVAASEAEGQTQSVSSIRDPAFLTHWLRTFRHAG